MPGSATRTSTLPVARTVICWTVPGSAKCETMSNGTSTGPVSTKYTDSGLPGSGDRYW